jgi:hypothetical protein
MGTGHKYGFGGKLQWACVEKTAILVSTGHAAVCGEIIAYGAQ